MAGGWHHHGVSLETVERFIKMFSSLTATVKAALAVGGTVAVGALVFGFGLPIGIVAGTVAAFGTKAALDKSA